MSTLRCLKMRLPPNRVSRSSQSLGNWTHQSSDVADQLLRQVLADAADAEVVGVHPGAGRALVEHHQLFALFEAPERRGERAHVHGLGGDVQQVVQDPPDFRIEHPDQRGADRAPRCPSASRWPGSRRAPGSSAPRSRGGRNRGSSADRAWPRSASLSRGAGGRCADRQRSTTSPSSSSTMRSTPCAAGCCGPKLMLNLRTFVSPWNLRGEELACRLGGRIVAGHGLLPAGVEGPVTAGIAFSSPGMGGA